jgi:uncharacterized RDD family membrane protein YckC
MSVWWYIIKDKKTGPIDLEALKKSFQTGAIGEKTMLWREGMEVWQPLDELEELNSLRALVPPPLPSKPKMSEQDYPLAKRWPRFFARIFDIWWISLLFTFVGAFFLSRYSAGFVKFINSPGSGQVVQIVTLPVVMIIDALLYKAFGNTPGKALLGIAVKTPECKNLSFDQYLGRNFSMWVRGFGLGIPLVNLFTMGAQSGRLGKGLPASYDEKPGYFVRAKPTHWARIVAFTFAFASLLVVISVLNIMDKEADNKARLESLQPDYTWQNPKTLVNIKVSPKWKMTPQKSESGTMTYLFEDTAGYAAVVFGMEDFPGYNLSDYVPAFKKGTAANMTLDGGRYFERNGRQIWEGTGRMTASDTARLNVQIVQVGSSFWRTVTIQSKPFDYSDDMVNQLITKLWSSIK